MGATCEGLEVDRRGATAVLFDVERDWRGRHFLGVGNTQVGRSDERGAGPCGGEKPAVLAEATRHLRGSGTRIGPACYDSGDRPQLSRGDRTVLGTLLG